MKRKILAMMLAVIMIAGSTTPVVKLQAANEISMEQETAETDNSEEISKVEFIGDYTLNDKPVFVNGMESVRFRITYADGTTEDLSEDDLQTENGQALQVAHDGYSSSTLKCYDGAYQILIDGKSYIDQEIVVWNLGENVKSFSEPGMTHLVEQNIDTIEKFLILCEETGSYTVRYTNPTDKETKVNVMVYEEDGSGFGKSVKPFAEFTGSSENSSCNEANVPIQMEAGKTYVVTVERAAGSDNMESLNYQLYFGQQPTVTGIEVKNDDHVVEASAHNGWGINGWPFEVTYSDGSIQHLHGSRGSHLNNQSTNPYLPYDDYDNSFIFALKDENQKTDFDNLAAGEYPVTITMSDGKVFEDVLKVQETEISDAASDDNAVNGRKDKEHRSFRSEVGTKVTHTEETRMEGGEGRRIEEAENIPVKSTKSKKNNVEIYALDEWAQKYISIPSKFKQKMKIKIDGINAGKIRWYSEDEKIAYVDEKGVIYPGQSIYRRMDGTTYKKYNFDEPVLIYGYQGDKKIEVTVTVKDYGEVYTDTVMDKYIKENISQGMSTYEKVEQVCKFVAGYDYNAGYSSAEGMIVSGEGGDCWASTDAVNKMCGKLNIRAGVRQKANRDYGAGGGHLNSYVVIDGKTYIVDVGYDDEAPRYYSISEIEYPFYYEEKADGTLRITLYEGYDKKVNIPSKIDGKSVSEIGEEAFSLHDEIQEAVIPDSVISIGNAVFEDCRNLKKVVLSKNLSVIPVRAFYGTNISKIVIPDHIVELQKESFSRTVNYSGPNGHYAYIASLEVIEIPKSVKKIALNLSDTTVLYHGSKKDWKKIDFDKSAVADSVFYSSKGVALSKTSLCLKEGETIRLKAYSVDGTLIWQSSNKNVATVSGGKIKAVKAGATTVTVETRDGKRAACRVRIKINPKKGNRYTVGKYKYKITGSSTVAFAGLKSSKTTKVTIPKTVKIGGKTFKVTSVAKNALKKQKKVTSITIGANVTSIGTSAFEGCSKLSVVTVGTGVTKIGANAFKNCGKLKSVTIKSTKLKSVGKNAFKGIKANAKIKVPAKKLNAYKRLLKGKGQGKKVKIVK